MNIRFLLYLNELHNYDTDVDEFEIINDSERTVEICSFGKVAEVKPHSVEILKADTASC